MQTSDALLLTTEHHADLVGAVAALENPNLAARIADYAGAPVSRVLSLLPPFADAGLVKAVDAAMQGCLRTAIRTLDGRPPRKPLPLLSSMAAGFTGGVSGFIGMAALPIELPITTTLMLRAIAAIARHNGEDLSQLEARLACIQVFALGARRSDALRTGAMRNDVGYLAARTLLTRATSNATAYLVERGTLDLSTPVVNRLLAEIVSRYAVVVSDRVAASAVPVIGAIGGATLNVIFTDHFQRIARGHFTIRRLERHYGVELVHQHYALIAEQARLARQPSSPSGPVS